jgi:hypothetical protein
MSGALKIRFGLQPTLLQGRTFQQVVMQVVAQVAEQLLLDMLVAEQEQEVKELVVVVVVALAELAPTAKMLVRHVIPVTVVLV